MALVFDHVSFAYDGSPREIVCDLSVHFPAGWTGIIGANGIGKSTVLQLASCLLVPTKGLVRGSGAALYCPQRTDTVPARLEAFTEGHSAEASVPAPWPWHRRRLGRALAVPQSRRTQAGAACHGPLAAPRRAGDRRAHQPPRRRGPAAHRGGAAPLQGSGHSGQPRSRAARRLVSPVPVSRAGGCDDAPRGLFHRQPTACGGTGGRPHGSAAGCN